MVITGTNGGSFCSDFGQVKITGLSGRIEVSYTITFPGGSDAFTEFYSPDSEGEVLISDLGQLARSYYKPDRIPLSPQPVAEAVTETSHIYHPVSFDTLVTIAADITDMGDNSVGNFSQKFFYSNCRTRIATPYQYRGFLSRHHRYTLRPGQKNILSFFQHGQKLCAGISFNQYDGEHWLEFDLFPDAGIPDDGKLFCLDLSVQNVCRMVAERVSIDADSVNYIIFYIKADGEVQDAIQVDIDKENTNPPQLLYYNCFGVPESICFAGREVRKAERESDYVTAQHLYRAVNSKLDITHEMNTGYISEVYRDCAEDLAVSEYVYLYDGENDPERVTITEISFEETSRPRTEPINVSVTYRMANEEQRIIERDMTIDYRIFDHTFGTEFE